MSTISSAATTTTTKREKRKSPNREVLFVSLCTFRSTRISAFSRDLVIWVTLAIFCQSLCQSLQEHVLDSPNESSAREKVYGSENCKRLGRLAISSFDRPSLVDHGVIKEIGGLGTPYRSTVIPHKVVTENKT
jgi:hypothetical protein